MNLVDGILQECTRCRELLTAYAEIGPAGRFGHAMIADAIRQGEAAIASGDAVECLAAYKRLQDCA